MEHKKTCPDNDNNLVFPSSTGNSRTPDHLYKRGLAPALRKAKIRNVTLHELRHTYASLLIAMGVNPKKIQKIMGHSSIKMTFDRYGHLFPDDLDGIGEQLDGFVFGLNSDILVTTPDDTTDENK